MWDCDHNDLPGNLSSYFKRTNLVHNYETRGKVNTLSYGIKSFKCQGVMTLNELQDKYFFSHFSFSKKMKNLGFRTDDNFAIIGTGPCVLSDLCQRGEMCMQGSTLAVQLLCIPSFSHSRSFH